MQKISKILILVFLLVAFTAQAQKYSLSIQTEFKDKIPFKKEHNDSLSVLMELKSIISFLHKKSYLLASVDTLEWKNKEAIVQLNVGDKIYWATISKGNIPENLLRKMDFKEHVFSNKPLKATQIVKIEQKLIKYSANNGYPFASVFIDSIKTDNNKISGVLNFDKNQIIYFDSIKVIGKTKTKAKFIQNYLQIKPNTPFNQQKLDNYKKLIDQLKSIKVTKHYQLEFKNEKAIVYLFLEDKKMNTIDGIGGFQQNPKDKKLLFTGQFDIGLKNIAGTGKSFEMHWKKTDVASQLLNLKYNQLSLFGSNFHTAVRFQLFKQDTSFIQRKPYWEFYYNHPVLGKLKFFYELDDSRTIGTKVTAEGIVPTLKNIKTNYYGFGIEWNNLDDIFFPRKGLNIDLDASAGNKKILDDTQDKSLQLKFNGIVEKHWRLNEIFGIYTKVKGALLQNENLYLNELFRLGGIQSFRGFREYNFYASEYVFGTLETRLFLDKESYLLLFSDYGFYANKMKGEKPSFNGPPLGIGLGLTFSTQNGIFSFIYAVGREGNNTLNFNNSVINFGLTSRF